MPEPLHILIVEDRPEDAELMVQELRRGNLDFEWSRVETEVEYRAALDDRCPDVVLSDYDLPQFDAFFALDILKGRWPDVPLIIVSGGIPEDLAVSALKRGAADYLLKDRLGRLAAAVRRVLDEKAVEEERRRAEAEARAAERRCQALIERSSDVIVQIAPDGRFLYVSPSVRSVLGYAPEEMVGSLTLDFVHPDDRAARAELFERLLQNPETVLTSEHRVRRKDGTWASIEAVEQNLIDHPGVASIVAHQRDVSERKRTEAELRSSAAEILRRKNELEAVIKASGQLLYEWWPSTGAIAWSGSVKEVLGYEDDEGPTDLAGAVSLLHPDDLEAFEAEARGALAEERPFHLTFRVRKANGTYAIVEDDGSFVRDESGRVSKLVGFMVDVTSRVESAAALRFSAEEILRRKNDLEAVIRASGQILYEWWPATGEMAWSGSVKEILGFEEGETPRDMKSAMEFIHPDDRVGFEAEASRAHAAETAFHLTFRLRKANGTYAIVEDNGYFVRDESGRVSKLVGFVVDVTSRVESEMALKESEARYRLLVETSPEAIVIHSASKIVYVNPAAVRLMGAVDAGDLLGRSVMDFVHPDSVTMVEARMRAIAEGETVLAPVEERLVTLSGQILEVELGTSSLFYLGRPAIQIVARDVTARKRAEERVRRSAERLQILHQIDKGLLEGLQPSAIAGEALRSMRSMIGFRHADVMEFRATFGDVLASEPDILEGFRVGSALPMSNYGGFEGILRELRSGKNQRLDLRALPPDWPVVAAGLKTGACHYLVAPLIADGILVGTLNLGFDAESGFSPQNEEVASEIAAELAIVIQQARQRQRVTTAETEYRDLFDRVPIGLFRTTPEGRYLDVNPALVKKLGFEDRHELMSCNAGDFYVDPADRKPMLAQLEAKGLVEGYQYRARRRDGTVIWLENSVRAIHGPDGNVAWYEGTAKDVTAQKQAVEAFEERLDLSQLAADVAIALTGSGTTEDLVGCLDSVVRLLGSSSAGIWTFDEAESVLELAATAGPALHLSEMYGRVPVGSTVIGGIAGQRASHFTNSVADDPMIMQEWARGEGIVAFAGYPLLVDRRLMGVFAVFAPEPLSLATVEALGSIAHGVAAGIQRKRGEDSLRNALDRAEESDRLKGAFLANMSHEIRTPLNVILGYTSLMADTGSDDEGNLVAVAAIRRASDRLLRTMNAILDVSKMTARAFDVTPEPIDLAEAVEQRVRLCEPIAREKGLEVSCTIDSRDVWVRFDAYCLSQALTHLLDNAVKFTEAGGVRVRLSCEASEGCVLEIADTGVGIDAAYLPRIFSIFTQERSGYTRPFEGAGLGLAVTKSYLEMNGASITVDSVAGRGSTVRVLFPSALITSPPVAAVPARRRPFRATA